MYDMCDKKVYVILVISQQTSRAGRNTKSGYSKQLSAMHFYLRMIYFWNLEDVFATRISWTRTLV